MKNLIKKILRESDDLDWIRTAVINPWVEYDAVMFDIEPDKEDVNTYIEMALNTRDISPGNATNWLYDRDIDLETISQQFRDTGLSYLSIEDSNYLYYGDDLEDLPNGTRQIKYSELKAANLNESDDFEWIKDLPIEIPITSIETNRLYEVAPTNKLYELFESCSEDNLLNGFNDITYVKYVGWKNGLPPLFQSFIYSEVFCNAYDDDHEVECLYITFYDKNQKRMGSCYVSQEMVKIHQISLNESDDFQWIKDTSINPWMEYDGIIFDTIPTEEEVNTYIEMCLNTRDVDNAKHWSVGRDEDIRAIMNYIKNKGVAYLALDDSYLSNPDEGQERNQLFYGWSLNDIDALKKVDDLKYIKYSELK